jgi:putative hydrolase of the HAD superfamily
LIRAVFFDLDDTLCDTIGTREVRARLAFEVIAKARPDVDCEAFISRVMEPAGERTVRGIAAVVEELGLSGTEAGESALGTWFFDGCMNTLNCADGAREVLEALNLKYTLGIITNGEEKLQRAKFEHLGFEPLVPHLVISEVVGFEKPDARIFQHALAAARVEASAAVFVGDRLDVDVVGAKTAGMRAIWFNAHGGSLDGSLPAPDAVVARFAELPRALARLKSGVVAPLLRPAQHER